MYLKMYGYIYDSRQNFIIFYMPVRISSSDPVMVQYFFIMFIALGF